VTARDVVLLLGKGLVFGIAFGAWGFAYHWLALGSCLECSVVAAVIYAAVSFIVVPLGTLWLLRSSWGRFRIYLRWFHKPSFRRVLVAAVVVGLAMGLTVFGATGAPWRIASVLVAWIVLFLTVGRLFAVLFGRDLGLR
jgi:hypothetical protein